MDATVDHLVEFTHGFRYENLDADALQATKVRIIDTLAGALAAYLAPPVMILRRLTTVVREGPTARVFGSLVPTTPDFAAFVNGSMARYLDFNDSYHSIGGGHPSDNLPGLIAVGEAFGLDGRALITGMNVAYEVHNGFSDAVDLGKLGWDQATSGVIAAALGAGSMLRLTPEQLRNAIALAITPNLPLTQTRVGELSMWKNCCTAMGARQGIFAALLAKEGMTGPVDPIEGAKGLWDAIGAKGTKFPSLDAPDRRRAVTQTYLKRWSVPDSCQLPVDTARDLYAQLNGKEIAAVSVRTYQKSSLATATRDRARWEPKTRESADHSMPCLVAMTLRDGAIYPERLLSSQHERFGDPDVVDLIRKMKIEYDPEYSKAAPEVRTCLIEAQFTDGTTVRALRKQVSEELAHMTPQELKEKFDQLTADVMLPASREALLESVEQLETRSVREVVDCLAI
jgi:2-methylcitrate dehydratase